MSPRRVAAVGAIAALLAALDAWVYSRLVQRQDNPQMWLEQRP